MKKITTIFFATLIFLLILNTANALVDVAFNFQNTANVRAEAFNCGNSDCSTAQSFSGSFPNGASTSNGQLTVRFPSTLSTQNGYAVFFASDGFAPNIAWTTLNSKSNDNVFTTSANVNFNKIPVCRSTIDEFSVTNKLVAFVPAVVSTVTGLDANTKSAFTLSQGKVNFVPKSLEDHFSADTKVTLTVKNSLGALVNEQVINLKIKASESQKVSFTWVPDKDGDYTATVKTEVTDNQCASAEPQSSQKSFAVLPQMPRNECYTLVNGLKVLANSPTIGQSLTTSFTKISNHANDVLFLDAGYKLTPVPTDVTLKVTQPDGSTLLNQAQVVNANSDEKTVSEQTFSWTPTQEGTHTISVTGKANSALCNGLKSSQETASMILFIGKVPTFKVTVQVISNTGERVSGANVNVGGLSAVTDSNGEATLSGFKSGNYNLAVSKDGFEAKSQLVKVADSDQTLLIVLNKVQSPQNPVVPVPPVVQKHSVQVKVIDGKTQLPVSGATITLSNTGAVTNDAGTVLFTNLADGTYSYKIQHKDYQTKTGNVVVAGADVLLTEELTKTQLVVQEKNAGRKNLNIHLGSIQIPGAFEVKPGEQVYTSLTFENDGRRNLEDVKIALTIPELNARVTEGPFDVDVGDRVTKRLLLDIPSDAQPGKYLVRVYMNAHEKNKGNNINRIVHREIEVN